MKKRKKLELFSLKCNQHHACSFIPTFPSNSPKCPKGPNYQTREASYLHMPIDGIHPELQAFERSYSAALFQGW